MTQVDASGSSTPEAAYFCLALSDAISFARHCSGFSICNAKSRYWAAIRRNILFNSGSTVLPARLSFSTATASSAAIYLGRGPFGLL